MHGDEESVNGLSRQIIGSAFAVANGQGQGFLEEMRWRSSCETAG
jgi:hypothetical protein